MLVSALIALLPALAGAISIDRRGHSSHSSATPGLDGWSNPSLARCQSLTKNVLEGCPTGTLVVDGSGNYTASNGASTGNHGNGRGNGGNNATTFSTIQAAVNAIPQWSNKAYTVLITPGLYDEQVNVTSNAAITLLGVTTNSSDAKANTVTIHRALANHNAQHTDNVWTANLIVAPTYNASVTGSGPSGTPVDPATPPGSRDFRVYNVDFINDYSPQSDGPSLALSTAYANTSFYGCGFYSQQDTIFIGKRARAYMRNCVIAGQTDFLYGFGTLWVAASEVQLRGCGGGVIAWKGSNETDTGAVGTYADNHYGCYLDSARLVASNSSVYDNWMGKCYLGRNWNSGHRSVIKDSYMDHTVAGQGYKKWTDGIPLPDTVLFGEYGSTGDGFNLTARVVANITHEMDAAEVGEWAFDKVFGGWAPAWIDGAAL